MHALFPPSDKIYMCIYTYKWEIYKAVSYQRHICMIMWTLIRPDIFNFSSFKNSDRNFQEMEKKFDFFITDRMKNVPNL